MSNKDLLATHVKEQEWNDFILSTPVRKPIFKIWTYSKPAVVLGCSQKKLLYKNQKRSRDELDIIIRKSGGGAVLVGPWLLSVSVALPKDHHLTHRGPVASFEWLGEVYRQLLEEMGLTANLIDPTEENKSINGNKNYFLNKGVEWACFGSLSSWELTVNEKKIVGLAQVRRKSGVLLVGGLLISEPEWSLFSPALGMPEKDIQRLYEITTGYDKHIAGKKSVKEVVNNLNSMISQKFNDDTL